MSNKATPIPRDMIDQVLQCRGVTHQQVAAALRYDGAYVLVDETHPAWTQKPAATLTPDQQMIAKRLDICRGCEHFGGEGTFNGLTLHCRHKGLNAGCVRCRASLLSDSAAEGCPLGYWSILKPDRIVCLSLDSRPDRWEALNASASKSKHLSRWKIERYRARLPNEFIIPDWFETKLPQRDSIYATGRDHMAIIERAYGSGAETLLVLEDDAIIQDCFDDAYKAACDALPPDWMALYLTTDGHQKKPVPIAPGLVRCVDQAMLHAVLYSRRGMHRVWHHLQSRKHQIIDGATEDLHSLEPHFYGVTQNAVRQMGCRYNGERTDFFDRVAIPLT